MHFSHKSLLILLHIFVVTIGLVSCVNYHHRSLDWSLNPAVVYLNTNSSEQLVVKVRNRECVKCALIELARLSSTSDNVTVTLDTQHPDYYFSVFAASNSDREYCVEYLSKTAFRMGENASYFFQILVDVTTNGSSQCSLTMLVAPKMSLYLPLYVALGALVTLSILYVIAKHLIKRLVKMRQTYINTRIINDEFGVATSNLVDDDDSSIRPPISSMAANSRASSYRGGTTTAASNNRIKSVDVLRGLSLAIMVFVNFGSGGYAILSHSVWNGLHLADLVFPCFVFVMGLAIPLSFRSLSAKSIDRTTGQRTMHTSVLARKIVVRTILLFFFGLVISNSSDKYLSELRVMGVLQRFAVCYLVCSLIELVYFSANNFVYVGLSATEQEWNPNSKWILVKSKFKEIFLYPVQWLFMLFLVLVWTLITFLLPVKGCPTGYLGPGGLHENASHFNCTGGAAGHIDRLLLGRSHIYQSPSCQEIYQTVEPYDPEGLLGCLTSCVLTYLGVVTGHVLIHYTEPLKRIARLILYALLWGSIGLALSLLGSGDGWIPINKNLWSLSFVLVMAAISLVMFAFLYVIIDVYDIYSGAPFVYLGRNSIVVYLGHEVLGGFFPLFLVPYQHGYVLAIDIYWVTLWTIVAAIMDYKRVYVNL